MHSGMGLAPHHCVFLLCTQSPSHGWVCPQQHLVLSTVCSLCLCQTACECASPSHFLFAPRAAPLPHSPAACRCSLASLSMLKGSLGASSRSQDGHTDAPGHLFEVLVGEGVTAASAACSWSSRGPTPIFKGSLGPVPVRDRKGRGGEMRRLDWGKKRKTGL